MVDPPKLSARGPSVVTSTSDGSDAHCAGVFACRSPYRPNLIALDVCKILSIDGLAIRIDKTHAFDETPILDLKPYIPNLDDPAERSAVRLPDWL